MVLAAQPAAPSAAEPDVKDTQVLQTQMPAEPVADLSQPVIAKPEALPDLPEPEPVVPSEPPVDAVAGFEPAVSTEPEPVIETGTESEDAVVPGTESEEATASGTEPEEATASGPELEQAAIATESGDAVAAGTESEPAISTEPEPVVETGTEPQEEAVFAATESEIAPAAQPQAELDADESRQEDIYTTLPEKWTEMEPESEPEAAVMQPEAQPEPESEPVPPPAVAAQAEPEPALEPEEHTEPVVDEPEPIIAAAAERAQHETVTSEDDVQAGPEAEPVTTEVSELPTVAEAAPTATSEPVAGEAVKATMLRWPGSTAPGNGSQTTQADTFEEATSIIPAWRHTDAPPDSKRTVSLQALPADEVASGTGFAAILTFESGPFAGRIVALPHHMVTIGRAPDNDVVVGDPATSGRHGRIEMRGGSFWIGDLGSTNGTLVNGEPVIEKQLSDGDIIAIGQNQIRFSLEA
jgi:hypothetical protein